MKAELLIFNCPGKFGLYFPKQFPRRAGGLMSQRGDEG